MKTKLSSYLRAMLLVSLCVLAWGAGKKNLEAYKSKSERFGLYNSTEIVWRSERMAHSLWKGVPDYRLTAEASTYANPLGQTVAQWRVECLSKSGVPLGEFRWNAQTGALMHVTSEAVRPLYHPEIATVEEAKQVATACARFMGLTTLELIDPQFQLSADSWTVRAKTERGRLTMTLNRSAGLLVNASFHEEKPEANLARSHQSRKFMQKPGSAV